MASRIVLIRAVNVGGAKLPMTDLRDLAAELGATDVSTYIASGNLLCTPPGDPAEFDRALEQAIEARFGFFREVISRSPAEYAAALTAHPFAVTNPKLHAIYALTATPSADGIKALGTVDFGADRWQVIGADLHLAYAENVHESKLTAPLIARKLGVQGTGRNLLTVAKLIDLCKSGV